METIRAERRRDISPNPRSQRMPWRARRRGRRGGGGLGRPDQAGQASSASSTRLAILAPQSHTIHTMAPSTPASSSPHWRWSVKNASSSVGRAHRREPMTMRKTSAACRVGH